MHIAAMAATCLLFLQVRTRCICISLRVELVSKNS
uniref:Uncharacterized protein n=1 Tax=Arundo donax TaxID=35708 RepID=A0A0A9FNY1_ARUDO